jgi:hypothetical protein
VTELRVAQRGETIELRFVAPRTSVDGLRLPVLDVEILRADQAGRFKDVATKRALQAAPGETIVESEPLPEPGTPLIFAIQTRAGRSASALSKAVRLEVREPPPAPEGFAAQHLPSGVRLEWSAESVPPAPTPEPDATTPAAADDAQLMPLEVSGDSGTQAPDTTPSPEAPDTPGVSETPVVPRNRAGADSEAGAEPIPPEARTEDTSAAPATPLEGAGRLETVAPDTIPSPAAPDAAPDTPDVSQIPVVPRGPASSDSEVGVSATGDSPVPEPTALGAAADDLPEAAQPQPTPDPTPEPPQTGLLIYRTTTPGTYDEPLHPQPLRTTQWVDTTVEAGGRYCYVARVAISLTPLIESASSPEECLFFTDVTPPSPPTGVSVVRRDDAVEVFWSPVPEPDTATYLVYRQKQGRRPRLAGQVPATQRSYRDLVVADLGAELVYRVVAVDAAGNESEPSSAAGLYWP